MQITDEVETETLTSNKQCTVFESNFQYLKKNINEVQMDEAHVLPTECVCVYSLLCLVDESTTHSLTQTHRHSI